MSDAAKRLAEALARVREIAAHTAGGEPREGYIGTTHLRYEDLRALLAEREALRSTLERIERSDKTMAWGLRAAARKVLAAYHEGEGR